MGKIYSETYITEIGSITINATDKAVISISYTDNVHNTSNGNKLTDKAAFEINDYAHGKIKEFTFPYEMIGTEFQKKVWSELLAIPYGQTKSYSEIASSIGSPSGARAVGNACNQNPLPIVIPCHRAIHKNGSLNGYAGGNDKKKLLLLIEGQKINKDICFCEK